MRKTKLTYNEDSQPKAVDTPGLQKMLCAGYRTAVKIGDEAGARMKIGKRVLWNVKKIQEYLDTISK